jgi:SAM-dependent methyltransferase
MRSVPIAAPHERIHEIHAGGRRLRLLSEALAPLMPPGARVLDVGCGDGRLAVRIQARRPDLALEGAEVKPRPGAAIAVTAFDGRTLPFPDGAFDVALAVDTLHHAEDPEALLRECARVAPRVVLKDHLRDPWLARPTLRFMDWVGNRRHGVSVPDDYWRRRRWEDAFARAGLEVEVLRTLSLFPPPLTWLFDRGLHFAAALRRRDFVPVAPGS